MTTVAYTPRRTMFAGALRRFSSVCLLLSVVLVPAFAQIDRGTIQGAVTDPSGAVIAGAKVKITNRDTNSALDLSTNGEGLFTAPNLPVGNYRVTVEAAGFGTFVREPVEIRSRVEVRVDATLQPGAVTETVNVADAAPLLDTAAVNNSASMKSDLIQELPMIVIGTKRDITGFLNNLPGTTQTNTFIPSVNAAPTGATEAFIDGAPASERIQRGAISENGPALEQVGEVNVVTGAFNAEYGGFGNWFTSVTIKSGTNVLHGSVFDHLGNDKLNARSFFQPRRTSYRQNEGGFTLGGPVVIPHVYDGKDKTFFFGSLGVFFSRYGASNNIITIPTQAFLRGDFSGLVNAAGVQIPIFDPDTTQPDGKGSYVRQQFPGNIIPANRISQAAKVVAQYMPAPNLPGAFNNYFSKAAATWPYYNTWTPLIKIDHSISTKQKLQGSFTAQRRPRIIWTGGMTDVPAWGQQQMNPLDNVFDQQANSWKVRVNHDYIFTPTVLNHITLSADRYYNLGINKTGGQGWNQKLGISGVPADAGEFPQISFSGGTAAPAQLNRAYDEVWHDLRYSFIENLSWVRGKHGMKFGFEIDRDWINRSQYGNASGTFGFANNMTSQPDSPSYGTWGNAYASFVIGAVNTASAYVPVSTGVRYIRYALFAQDEWRATTKFTLSYGLRWDYMPMYSEVHDQMSSFSPSLPNPGAGGRPGALAFAGSGPGRSNINFVDSWKKGFGPRLGVSYQVTPKTVVRASSGIYYANWGGGALNYIYTAGFSASPAFSSPDGFSPLFSIGPGGSGQFPQNFVRPPALDPSFLNGQAISYSSRDGARLPQTINWTFSIQRQLASNLSVEAVYLGSRSTHLNFNANYDYMPISGLQYGSTLLQPINSPAAATAGIKSPFPGFENQLGANTVYQALRPYPQYTAVTTNVIGDPAGQQKFNSLQIKVNKRFSKGLTLFGFFDWMKSFSLVTDQYPGSRIMQLDPNPAASFSFSWAYDLPFGKGKQLLTKSPRWVNATVSGWKVNGFVKYMSGIPLSITAGAGFLSAIGYSQRGNAVAGVSPYLVTNPRDFNPSTNKFLNAAAFTTSTGFNFGNLAPNLSWVRGFWSKQEALTIGRVFGITERVKLDLSADAVNPFNFHRWTNPNTNLTSAAFGTVTGASDGRTLQINAAVRF
jgi:hypothetical protein